MKNPTQAYTTEFKELAVKRIKDGRGVGTICRELGRSDPILRHGVKASAAGKLKERGQARLNPLSLDALDRSVARRQL